MSFTLIRRRAGVLLVFLTFLLQCGCQTGKHTAPAEANHAISSHSQITAPPIANAQKRVEAHVYYATEPDPFSFRVGDQNVGTNVHALIGWLQSHAVTDVVFDSQYKLTRDTVHDLVKQISQPGIVIREFWVPRAAPPGRLNVLSGH